eukprot:gb/GEZN01004401.1/.p1 GENE.gb/GEZN01004401.1/~~gb/GEZN01004401.1/.p1  ORF type:complete len:491 (+),score=78.41 gb/GEZN01004401.1/:33-1505(+)
MRALGLSLKQLPQLAGRRALSTTIRKAGAQELLASPLASQDAFLTKLAHYPETDLSVLNNGIRVASEPAAGETATVAVCIDAGSRYETAANNGVAHFAEHMFFKGTSKRTRQQLEMEFENMGGHLNAYTSREQTVFYAKVFKQQVGQAIEILSDILQNSEFREEAISNERRTIMREYQEVQNQPTEVIFDLLHETAYRDTPLGFTILGSPDNIEGENNITRKEIVDYLQTHYTAPRMVIAAAGAVEHKQIAELAQKHFGSVPREAPNGRKVNLMPAYYTGSDIRIREDDIDMAHVAYAFPTFGWKDPDNYPLMVMQSMLGAWEKYSPLDGSLHPSPLCAELARDNLVEKVMAFNTSYSDTGLFGIYTIGYPVGQQNAFTHICDTLTSFSYEVDEQLMDMAKKNLMMTILTHQLDGSTQVAEDIGRQLLTLGRRVHPMETYKRIEAVDVNAIKAVARRVLYDRDHAMAAMGNLHELPNYSWFRNRSYWLRF